MNKARLLIIDDQPDVRAEVKERIESMGYETDEAAYLEEALRKIREIRYECALLDLSIPLKLEGVPRIDHGKNLLQRIVSMPDPPPIIIITSHGLDGHRLAVEMMELGAETFVGKPFVGGELELKVQKIVGGKKEESQTVYSHSFEGGALVLSIDGIELCGIPIVVRSTALILKVVERLSIRKNDKYLKKSAKALADDISGSVNPPSVTSAISDFRDQCVGKLSKAGIECSKDDVIHTVEGGGYQLREWIQVRLGREEISTEIDGDCSLVMRIFGQTKKTPPRSSQRSYDSSSSHSGSNS